MNDRESSSVVDLVVSGVEKADPVTATGSDKVSTEVRVNDRVSSSVVDLVVSCVEKADPVTATGSDKVSPDWSSLNKTEAKVISSTSGVWL